MRQARSRLARIGLPLLGGGLIGLSLPPIGLWPVGVVGMGVFVASLKDRRAGGRLGAGMLAALGQFSICLAWAIQFNTAGYVALVVVESAILALGAVLVPPRGLLRVPAAAGALTIAEWARQSWPFGGLPLGSAALGQVGGPLQFTARLGGPLLVVFALALGAGALAEAVVALASRAASRRSGMAPPSPVAAGLGVVACGGLVLGGIFAGPSVPTGPRADSLSVAIVQGGGRRGLDELQVPPSQVFDAAVSETARVKGHPRFILWPEDVVSMGTERFVGSATERELAEIARSHRATLVAGVTEDVGATRFLNEVVAFSPSGRLVATFEKVHRVPFGEYVPYRSFFKHLANLSDIPRDAVPGRGSGMIRTPAGRFAVMISYEVFFADRGRSGTRAGGQLLLVPTNTSSYSTDQAPSQEIAASQLQALEEGRYLLQSAPTGYSAVVSSSGVVRHRSALSKPDVIETTVPLLSDSTPFEQAGDLPVLIASAILVLAGWVLFRREPNRKGAVTQPRRRRRHLRRSPSPSV